MEQPLEQDQQAPYEDGPALLVNAAAGIAGSKRRRRKLQGTTDDPGGLALGLSPPEPEIRPFVCLHEGCGKGFSRELHLQTHLRTVSEGGVRE